MLRRTGRRSGFVTPIRRYADTPIRRHADTPIRRYADTPIRRYADTPIRRHAPTSPVANLQTGRHRRQLFVSANGRLGGAGREARRPDMLPLDEGIPKG